MPLIINPNQFDDSNNLALFKACLGSFPVLGYANTTMATVPTQQVSPGHARFVGGIILFATHINPDGSTVAVIDTETHLVVSSTLTVVIATVDPLDNRKVILTASSNASLGGSPINGVVIVNTDPVLPNNIVLNIPFTFTPAVDRRSILWDPAQGGTQGDVV